MRSASSAVSSAHLGRELAEHREGFAAAVERLLDIAEFGLHLREPRQRARRAPLQAFFARRSGQSALQLERLAQQLAADLVHVRHDVEPVLAGLDHAFDGVERDVEARCRLHALGVRIGIEGHARDQAADQSQDDGGGGARLVAIPTEHLAPAIPGVRRPGVHGVAAEVTSQIAGQLGRHAVAPIAILLDRALHDPVEFAAQRTFAGSRGCDREAARGGRHPVVR